MAHGPGDLQLFVFPLDEAVFFPHTTIPLNIFEPRYLQMLNDAVDNGIPIAICSVDPLDPDIKISPRRPIVAGFGAPEVIESRSDGTKVVLLHGRGRVKLQSMVQESPYVICRGTVLEDPEPVRPENLSMVHQLKQILHHWIEENLPEDDQQAAFRKATRSPPEIVDALSTLLIRDFDLQQTLLEKPALNDRVRMLAMLLQADGSILAANQQQLN